MRVVLSHSETLLRTDGIVQVTTKEHNYSVADLKAMNAAQGEVCGGIKRPLLVIVHPEGNIDNEVREYMASKESTRFSLAEAFVITSIAHKILANFYLKINKPGVPTQIFNDVKAAEEWLRSYLPSDL